MISAMENKKAKVEAILRALDEWQASQDDRLGTILATGQLADVEELERIYALPSEED
jgi:hypothetical protein